jgi:broad specificity phosphatase PhoE
VKIILVRHGITDANTEERFLSRTDLALNDAGRAQALALAPALADVDIVFASPMKRCIETARLAFPGRIPAVCDHLREINFGDWELLTASEIEERFPGQLAKRRKQPVSFRPPHGESFADVAARLNLVLPKLKAKQCAVVSHRGTLSVLERLLLKLPLESQDVRPLHPAETRSVAFMD